MVIKKPINGRTFKVGDKVRFRYSLYEIEGCIIEDRGAIARGGQRLYRMRFDFDGSDKEIELPEESLQPVALHQSLSS